MSPRHPPRGPRWLALTLIVIALPPALHAATGGQLDLGEVVDLALATSERALATGSREAAARASVSKARASFLPTVTLTGIYAHNSATTAITPNDSVSATASAQLAISAASPLPLYRQVPASADAEIDAARDDRRLLAFDAARAYLAVLGATTVVASAAEQVALADTNLNYARARVAASLASSNDATRAELALAEARTALAQAQGELVRAQATLGSLIGRQAIGPLAPAADLLAAARRPIGAEGVQIDAALARRLDVRAARARSLAASEGALAPSRRLIPALDLLGQYRVASNAFASGDHDNWAVSVTLTWVLWDGGARGADADLAQAQARLAQLEVSAAGRQVELEVRQARAALGAAQAQGRSAAAQVSAARQNLDEVRILYQRGLARALEVADATSELFVAEVQVANAEFALGGAQLDLYAALGLDPLGLEPAPR
jgi:outer membrane protein TolC